MSIGIVCPSVPRRWLPTPAYALCSRRLRSYRAKRQYVTIYSGSTRPWPGGGGGLFADFVKNGSAELGFMRPRNECTELFAEHTYSPEHTYSACLSSCSSPVQPIHPEQGLPPSTRIDGWHELRCYSTVAPVGTYQLIFLLGLIAKAVWILTNVWRK